MGGSFSMRLLAIGTSLGGLRAAQIILAALPDRPAGAILLVQHRAPGAHSPLAEVLQQTTLVPIQEAEDKLPLEAGRIYLAPPDYHLLVDGDHLALSLDEPVHYARPSIDVLFESVAAAAGRQAVGVLLTGASADGAAGLAAIKRRGGLTLVQDPHSAEAATLPLAAIASQAADYILPLEELSDFVARLMAADPPYR